MSIRVVRIVVTIAVAACGIDRIGAQDAPRARSGWLPIRGSVSSQMTTAQKEAAAAKLLAIVQVLRQVPELGTPRDFEVTPVFQGGTRRLGFGDVEDRANVYEYGLDLGLCDSRFEEGHRCGSIFIDVNFLNPPGNFPIHDQQGRAIYIEAPRGDMYRVPDGPTFSRESVPLATETYYKLSPTERSWVTVIFTADRELPWKPVTREEYYNAVVFDIEGKDGSKLAEFRKANRTSAYQQWLAGADQRRKERQETLAALKGIQTPVEIEKLRKTLEESERETGEQLKAADAADPDANKKALAASNTYQDAVRAELGKMTASERRMAALVDLARKDGLSATGSTMTDRDSPTVQRVLTPNLDFWRARKSPVEARGISVHINASAGGGPPPPAVHNALWQTYKKLDWAAINRLLDHTR
jgi:hypothetical protein